MSDPKPKRPIVNPDAYFADVPNPQRPIVNPDAYFADVPNPQRRADCLTLCKFMQRLTGEPAVMWGSIIGFGEYQYKYASGLEGDLSFACFANRKSDLVIYIMGQVPDQAEIVQKLGKHRMGKSCLYIKCLDAIDMDVLEILLTKSIKAIRQTYS